MIVLAVGLVALGFYLIWINLSEPNRSPESKSKRVMCSDCRYHSAAMAGWQWDRCSHPDADLGNIVRNDQKPTCEDIRNSWGQCGITAKWFEPTTSPIQIVPVKAGGGRQ